MKHRAARWLGTAAAMRILPLFLAYAATPVVAQRDSIPGGERIQVLGADKWTFDEKLAPGAQRLIGHARFQHAGAIMSCDSAYIHDDQSVQAFGHVNISQGDTLRIAGDHLDYTGKDRVATLSGNVRLSDREMDLTTPGLTYDLRTRTASYTQGGTIVSRTERNTLTSDRGSYLAGAHRFIFSGHVVLLGPDRSITSDTLHYVTTTGMAEFHGPTTLTSGATRMWCTSGTYDTRKDIGHFTRRAHVRSGGQDLQGDSLHYERGTGIGQAWGHVALTDSANGMAVIGHIGRHEERSDRSWVTGMAELVMRMGDDSLHLHADTLYASTTAREGPEGTSGPRANTRTITARRGVRFFKSDLSGVCDTMVYSDADSTIHLISGPVLWSGDDQISGRDMRILMKDGRAHRLFVQQDAFLSAQVDSTRFDQVTGTDMTGWFRNGELHRLIAEGNCRTVYFAREEPTTDSTGTRSAPELIGMNRVDCSRIQVDVREGDVDVISFLAKPDGTMYPVALAPAEEMRLRGFVWRGAERPMQRTDIFR